MIETAIKITIILSCSMLYYKQKICDKEGEQMTIDLALEKMIPGMQEIYGDLVDSIILYGSTARGTRAEDSDVDVAILLHAGATKAMRDQMLDLVVDLELECALSSASIMINLQSGKILFRSIKTSERMALFYGRQLNGTMKETAIKSTFIFKGFMLYCK